MTADNNNTAKNADTGNKKAAFGKKITGKNNLLTKSITPLVEKTGIPSAQKNSDIHTTAG